MRKNSYCESKTKFSTGSITRQITCVFKLGCGTEEKTKASEFQKVKEIGKKKRKGFELTHVHNGCLFIQTLEFFRKFVKKCFFEKCG